MPLLALKLSGVGALDVTMHVEDSGLTGGADTASHENRRRLLGYATVDANLALKSKRSSRERQGSSNTSNALIAAAVVLITWVHSRRASMGMTNSWSLSDVVSDAEQLVACAVNAVATRVADAEAHQE